MSDQDFLTILNKYHNWLIAQFSKKYPDLDQEGIFSEFYLRTSASILAAVEQYILNIIKGLSLGDLSILPLEVTDYLCNKLKLTDTKVNKKKMTLYFFVDKSFNPKKFMEGRVLSGNRINIIFEKWINTEPISITDDIDVIVGEGKLHDTFLQGLISGGIKLNPGFFNEDIKLVVTGSNCYSIDVKKEDKLTYLLQSDIDTIQIKKELIKKIILDYNFFDAKILNDTIYVKTYYKIIQDFIISPVTDNIIKLTEDEHKFYYQIKDIGLDDVNYFEDNLVNNEHIIKINKSNYKNIPIYTYVQPFYNEVYQVLKNKYTDYKIKPFKPIIANIRIIGGTIPEWMKKNIEFIIASYFSSASSIDRITTNDIILLLNSIQKINVEDVIINYMIYTDERGFVDINNKSRTFSIQDFNVNCEEYSYYIGDISYE